MFKLASIIKPQPFMTGPHCKMQKYSFCRSFAMLTSCFTPALSSPGTSTGTPMSIPGVGLNPPVIGGSNASCSPSIPSSALTTKQPSNWKSD